ncbi:hypothetical protein PPTG_24102 [Phytophthora nicotianae INRA-310]|uniref:Uncharacterized protein n=1 Tax=Phytophthora nicotianae (strain INRA-310) TaxID=761204 RepID=W2PM76_PHYN3|nr:hypothetical protein PPTG_24102 [Phytophthora nicotianae INRA-310]ETN01339.1 hypothetical protein PPTG_24102 [Phytophthora nicotianae INRA-310]
MTRTSRATTTQATMQAASSSANSTDTPAYFVMVEDLKPWELYSFALSVGKTTNFAYTHTMPCSARGALSSDAGTPRDVKASLHVLARRPRGQLEQPRYGDLRERVCQLAQREWQNCYVHLVEGCGNCSEARDRPTRTEWEHLLDLWLLSEVERQAVGRYDRSWSQLEQAGLRNTLHHRVSRRH